MVEAEVEEAVSKKTARGATPVVLEGMKYGEGAACAVLDERRKSAISRTPPRRTVRMCLHSFGLCVCMFLHHIRNRAVRGGGVKLVGIICLGFISFVLFVFVSVSYYPRFGAITT